MVAGVVSLIVLHSASFGVETADAVLRRSAKLYASLKSYTDVGTVTINTAGNVRVVEFKTIFDRRKGLRLGVTPISSGLRPSAFWASARGGYQLVYEGARPRAVTLKQGLQSLAGPTGTTSMDVPALLLPKETGGGTMLRMKAPSILDHTVLEGVKCYEIVSPDWSAGRDTVWIEEKTGLIRQFEWRIEFPKVQVAPLRTPRRQKPGVPPPPVDTESITPPSTVISVSYLPSQVR